MYGYIRPLKPELRIREFERYNAAYCGLCRQLGKSYGFPARFAVNYDCTLPALMAAADGSVCVHRCPARFGAKKPCLCGGKSMELTAAATVILVHHKLADTVQDGGFFKRLGAKLILGLGKRKFKKASDTWPEFASNAESCLSELSALEKDPPRDKSVLDRTADCFARVTAGFSLLKPEGSERRIWHEIYYHIGRVIYILDAADDWQEDLSSGNFNPAVMRYGATEKDNPETKEAIQATLEHSLAAAAAAFELLPRDASTAIAGNVLYLGIPNTVSAVLNGEKKSKKIKRKM